MLVVNLFGAPGSGKSTIQADVFRLLKQNGVSAEIIIEWAKMLTYEQRRSVLTMGQVYILGKTLFDMRVLEGKVDVLVLDSPIVLGACYDGLNEAPTSDMFLPMVADIHHQFDNINYMLNRSFPYVGAGRNQDEENAKKIDGVLRSTMERFNIDYTDLDSGDNAAEKIVRDILFLIQ